ncbi:hypothetical protein Emag_000164 [Eimeria magna]
MKRVLVPGVRGLLGTSCLFVFLASGGIQFVSGVQEEESSTTHYDDSDDDVSRSFNSSPDSSERFLQDSEKGPLGGELAVEGPSSLTEEEEEDERVESEDYETAASRRGRKSTPSTRASSMLLAKQNLSADEYAQAEAEVLAELELLNRFHATTTTTPRPGFFKEVSVPAAVAALAVVVALVLLLLLLPHAILSRPGESLRSSSGSAALAISKMKDVATGKEGGVKELARDWWRLFTMSPDRMKEAEAASMRAALDGSAASRNLMRSDGATAVAFGSKLDETREAERLIKELSEGSKSEDLLQREFEDRMRHK